MTREVVYSIPDWDARFEKADSRKYKKLTWVAFPAALDTDEYSELANHPNGAAHLGAWLAIVLIASKCNPRGVLVRSNGRPHDAVSLSLLSRLPAKLFKGLLPMLVEMGMLAQSAGVPGESAGVPGESAGVPVLHNMTRQDRTPQTKDNRTLPNPTPQDKDKTSPTGQDPTERTRPAGSSATTDKDTLLELEKKWKDENDPEVRMQNRMLYQQMRASINQQQKELTQ